MPFDPAWNHTGCPAGFATDDVLVLDLGVFTTRCELHVLALQVVCFVIGAYDAVLAAIYVAIFAHNPHSPMAALVLSFAVETSLLMSFTVCLALRQPPWALWGLWCGVVLNLFAFLIPITLFRFTGKLLDASSRGVFGSKYTALMSDRQYKALGTAAITIGLTSAVGFAVQAAQSYQWYSETDAGGSDPMPTLGYRVGCFCIGMAALCIISATSRAGTIFIRYLDDRAPAESNGGGNANSRATAVSPGSPGTGASAAQPAPKVATVEERLAELRQKIVEQQRGTWLSAPIGTALWLVGAFVVPMYVPLVLLHVVNFAVLGTIMVKVLLPNAWRIKMGWKVQGLLSAKQHSAEADTSVASQSGLTVHTAID